MSVHLATRKIIKEWTDYNEHMNMAYYVLIFDEAWETVLNKFKMGGSTAKTSKRTTMVVETRTTYNSEVKENAEVERCPIGIICMIHKSRYSKLLLPHFAGHL